MKLKSLINSSTLTMGKIYDVMSYALKGKNELMNVVTLISDDGILTEYYLHRAYFEDVTAEYRDEVIDTILL